MAIETGLEGKPWYVSAIVGAVLAGAIVFCAHYVQFTKMNGQLVRMDTELSKLQAQINEGRAAQASLERFREEVHVLELELEKLLGILPPKRNTDDLLRRVRNLTEQGDFTLLRFTPGALKRQDFYSEWPIRIQLEGSYHDLALFFDRVSRFKRIINIDQLKIGALRNQGRTQTITATFTASTFLYNEPEPES
ncbi:MAG: type 4a pilus biogenesis protein PilO [Thermoanaerobaculia bacterium]|nr:type 4a pilus biogenesis protein PilO [Thermoanaerobaculia bacterium]